MADPTQAQTLADIKTAYYTSRFKAEDANGDIIDAEADLDYFGDQKNCLLHIFDALKHLKDSCLYATYVYDPYWDYRGPVPYYLEKFSGGEELTWQAICEAWAANDFEGRTATIAFIDRMRQLIWNEPFFVEWAAQPELEY